MATTSPKFELVAAFNLGTSAAEATESGAWDAALKRCSTHLPSAALRNRVPRAEV
jgi:hypothetical protein